MHIKGYSDAFCFSLFRKRGIEVVQVSVLFSKFIFEIPYDQNKRICPYCCVIPFSKSTDDVQNSLALLLPKCHTIHKYWHPH